MGYMAAYGTGNPDCYVSGSSPSLFLYTPKEQNISITLPVFLTYADPAVVNGNIWNVIANSNGTIQTTSGQTFPYLYYEYNKGKVSVSEPQAEFSIPSGQWDATVRNNIAAKLSLTQMKQKD